MRFKNIRKMKQNEIAEINQILKEAGLNRKERRKYLKLVKKEARIVEF